MTNMTKDTILSLLKSNDANQLNDLYQCESSDFGELNPALGKLVEECSSYDETDLNTASVQLEKNFCRERLQRLIEIKLRLIELGAKLPEDEQEKSSTSDDEVSNDETVIEQLDTQVIEDDTLLSEDFLLSKNLVTLKTILLNAVMDNSESVEKLKQFASLVQKIRPDVFNGYMEDEFSEAINKDKSYWQPRYFHEQNISLESNFAFERYNHLLEIREHLRKEGYSEFQFIAKTEKKEPLSKQSKSHGKSENFAHEQQKSLWEEFFEFICNGLKNIKNAPLPHKFIDWLKRKFQ